MNRNLAATLKLCGPAVLATSKSENATPLEQVTSALMLILQRNHPCQKDEDDFDEAPMEGESAEYDWLVVETGLEVVAALSTALGDQFGELWQIFETPVMKFCSSQERFERCAAVGTVADCVESMGGACTPYTSRTMKVLLKRLSDEDAETKSNAAFGMGLLCANSNDAKEILSNYNHILSLLEPMLSNDDLRAIGRAASTLREKAPFPPRERCPMCGRPILPGQGAVRLGVGRAHTECEPARPARRGSGGARAAPAERR